MKQKDDGYGFLRDIRKRQDAERNADTWEANAVTPERAEYLEANYPKDTPGDYKRIKPEEFFDGA